MNNFKHETVLLEPVVTFLKPVRTGIYVDATIGGGGHSEAILSAMVSDEADSADKPGFLIGLDRDPEALAAAGRRLSRFGDKVRLIQSNFRRLDDALDKLHVDYIDGIVFDLGVSSRHLDEGERGFTYWGAVPLDMRMGPDAEVTAADLIRTEDEHTIARILREYGEERWADRIASFIVEARAERSIETADQLVDIIKAAIPAGARRHGPHPARRTFQALRIAVNDELSALTEALHKAVSRLKPGATIAVISFHSLEDRIVKKHFSQEAASCICPPELPVCRCTQTPRLHVLTRKPVVPSEEEIGHNPRARSAKLRVAKRVLGQKETE